VFTKHEEAEHTKSMQKNKHSLKGYLLEKETGNGSKFQGIMLNKKGFDVQAALSDHGPHPFQVLGRAWSQAVLIQALNKYRKEIEEGNLLRKEFSLYVCCVGSNCQPDESPSNNENEESNVCWFFFSGLHAEYNKPQAG
jgi:hypothetical protein